MAQEPLLNQVVVPDPGVEDEAMAQRLSGLQSPAPDVAVITCQGHTDPAAVSRVRLVAQLEREK